MNRFSIENGYTVSFSDTDPYGKLFLGRLLELNQDNLTRLVSTIGFDNEKLRSDFDAAWFFAKTVTTYLKAVGVSTEINIVSYLARTGSLMAQYVTEFYYDRSLIAKVFTDACIFSFEKNSTLNLPEMGFPIASERTIQPSISSRIDLTSTYRTVVRTSLLDSSKHMNNTKCISLVIDTMDSEEYLSTFSVPFSISMKYKAQAREGDNLVIQTGSSNDIFRFDILNDAGICISGVKVALESS